MKNIMKNDNTICSIAIGLVFFLVFLAIPKDADAFKAIRLIDPFCFTCNNNDHSRIVVNNISNSNNIINSNNTHTVINNSQPVSYPYNYYNNQNYVGPVIRNYPIAPVYYPTPTYPYQPAPQYNQYSSHYYGGVWRQNINRYQY